MEPYTLTRKQRVLCRGDRHLKLLEREQLKAIQEVTGALGSAKKRLEKRQAWLRGLEEALGTEETSLKQLEEEFSDLLGEAIKQAEEARVRVQEEYRVLEQELQQMEEQGDTFVEEKPAGNNPEPQGIKVFVRPLTEEMPKESSKEIPESEVRVQWYQPGQSGFSL